MSKTKKQLQEQLEELRAKHDALRTDYLLMIEANQKSENLIISYRNVIRDLMEEDGGINEFIDIESDDGQEMISKDESKDTKFDVYIN